MVDFWAPWCKPCVGATAILEQLGAEHAARIEVVSVDVDANPDVASRYGVLTLPTAILFEAGEARAEVLGARRRSHYDEAWARWLRQGKAPAGRLPFQRPPPAGPQRLDVDRDGVALPRRQHGEERPELDHGTDLVVAHARNRVRVFLQVPEGDRPALRAVRRALAVGRHDRLRDQADVDRIVARIRGIVAVLKGVVADQSPGLGVLEVRLPVERDST